MIYYLAGSPSPEHLERESKSADANNFLFTFAEPGARKCAEYFCVQPQRRLFIDSGAYSVWEKGAKVDLGEYIAFCKKIMSMAKCQVSFAALDVIPGSKGSSNPTDSEIARACDEGWDNYQTMKQEGIPCLMTFHQFEHRKQLTLIANDSEYFAVAPRKRGVTNRQKLEWLASIFQYLGVKEGPGRKKIHGLGVSSTAFMMQFPFYSVDNTAWLQCFRSHARAVLTEDGFHTKYWRLRDFEKRTARERVSKHDLREMLGYSLPSEKADPNGAHGYYYLMYLAMSCAVETQFLITEFWRSKGVVWEDHQYKWDAVLRECLSCRNLLERYGVS